jgi:hypothetical protein
MKFAFLTATLLTTSAFAQVALPASGLTPALQQKLAATALLLDEPDSWCTASPITPDGYMLTALHCVRTCLSTANVGENATNPFIGLNDIFVSNRSKTGGINCPTLSIPALGVKGVTVVATGSALSQFDAHFMFDFPSLYNELKSSGFASRTNDYAILKIAVTKPIQCLPINANGASAGTSIWAVGFPVPADEKAKPTLQASPGHVYASALDSRMYADAKTPRDQALLTSLYSEAGVLYSNASNNYGQSGGPVITADGSIVGVVSGFTNFGDPEVHELVAPSTASFMRSLPLPLAQELMNKTAACR